MPSVYFGGSRFLSSPSPLLAQVVAAVFKSGQSIHVGCQRGADAQVLFSCPRASSLVVFAVAPSLAKAPAHVKRVWLADARVVFSAGGFSALIKARYLLRSIAAFQSCESAVFFSPGSGSLAVARECVRSGLPVFAFGEMPAPIPESAGQWVASSFQFLPCWLWQSAQLSFT